MDFFKYNGDIMNKTMLTENGHSIQFKTKSDYVEWDEYKFYLGGNYITAKWYLTL